MTFQGKVVVITGGAQGIGKCSPPASPDASVSTRFRPDG